MSNILDIADYAGAQRREREDTGGRTGEVIIFPGVRIDYSAMSFEDNPQGPSHSPRRARRRDA